MNADLDESLDASPTRNLGKTGGKTLRQTRKENRTTGILSPDSASQAADDTTDNRLPDDDDTDTAKVGVRRSL